MIKRIVNIAKSHREAEEWDIVQQISMSIEERQKVAKELKKRFYGERVVDIREYYKRKNDKR